MAAGARDHILKKIREALSTPTPLPYPESEGRSGVYEPIQQDADIAFAEKFIALQGKFSYCESPADLRTKLNALIKVKGWEKIYCSEPLLAGLTGPGVVSTGGLAGCDAAITGCEYLVARTGSIVLSAAQPTGRTASVYAPVHLCIAYAHQVVSDISDALEDVKKRYRELPSLITFATGPSRTADIEKTLVVGVHGPKEVYVFLVEDVV